MAHCERSCSEGEYCDVVAEVCRSCHYLCHAKSQNLHLCDEHCSDYKLKSNTIIRSTTQPIHNNNPYNYHVLLIFLFLAIFILLIIIILMVSCFGDKAKLKTKLMNFFHKFKSSNSRISVHEPDLGCKRSESILPLKGRTQPFLETSNQISTSTQVSDSCNVNVDACNSTCAQSHKYRDEFETNKTNKEDQVLKKLLLKEEECQTSCSFTYNDSSNQACTRTEDEVVFNLDSQIEQNVKIAKEATHFDTLVLGDLPVQTFTKADGFARKQELVPSVHFQKRPRKEQNYPSNMATRDSHSGFSNRFIYDQLKKIAWVDGYFSEGESIHVYINLKEMDRTLEDLMAILVQKTGASQDKFKIRDSDER